jgi:hypothetical protein
MEKAVINRALINVRRKGVTSSRVTVWDVYRDIKVLNVVMVSGNFKGAGTHTQFDMKKRSMSFKYMLFFITVLLIR